MLQFENLIVLAIFKQSIVLLIVKIFALGEVILSYIIDCLISKVLALYDCNSFI